MRTRVALLALLLAAPSLAAGRTTLVELGKAFRLKKGDSARVDGGKAFLRIVKFIDSPCPKNARCIWSGQSVVYELTVNGKIVQPGSKGSPYDVAVKDSDYRTFAVFVVDDPRLACSRPETSVPGECLRALARRRDDPALCREISDERTRGFCLEDLAEALDQEDLCAGVASPTQHCLYVKARKAGDRALCDGIVTLGPRERCLKELAKPSAAPRHEDLTKPQ